MMSGRGTRSGDDRREPGSAVTDGAARAGLTERWVVWRQDESGTRYLVSHHRARAEAERRCTELERGGHKQTYWVDRRHPEVGSTGE